MKRKVILKKGDQPFEIDEQAGKFDIAVGITLVLMALLAIWIVNGIINWIGK